MGVPVVFPGFSYVFLSHTGRRLEQQSHCSICRVLDNLTAALSRTWLARLPSSISGSVLDVLSHYDKRAGASFQIALYISDFRR